MTWVRTILTPGRVRRWAVAFAVVMWGLVVVASIAFTDRQTPLGGQLQGDYRVFWTAGRLVLDGDATAIWDPAAIQARSPDLFPAGRLAYPYPPHLALAEAPLSLLPFRAAYLVHALLMLGALTAATLALGRVNPTVARWRTAAVAAVVGFPPVFSGSAGGQNAGVVLLLTVGGFALVEAGRPRLGEVTIGLLAYKPQFLLAPGGWVVATGRAAAARTAAAMGAVWYLVAVPWFGWDWPARWLDDGMTAWNAYQGATNRGDVVSPVAIARTAPDDLRLVALAMAVAVTAWLVVATVRRWPFLDASHRVGAVAALALLVSPSALWYELGLALPAYAAYAGRVGQRGLPVLVGVYAVAWVSLVEVTPVNVGVGIALAGWWLCVQPTWPLTRERAPRA